MRAVPALAALGAIAALALLLRLVGTDWGAPYAYHFDEPFVVKPALRMVASSDPNPHFFRYPSLLLYLEAAVIAARSAGGAMPLEEPYGTAYGPSDLLPETWPALADGRRMVAVFGALAVLAVGLLGRATRGAMAGTAAAALLALLPLHVEHSHYLTTDVPMSTLVAVAFAALACIRQPTLAAAASGVAAGLAIGTKYTAAAAVPALALICMTGSGPAGRRVRRTAVLFGACAAGFALATPYALLDFESFAAELRIVRDHYRGGHLGAEGTWNWAWYFDRMRSDGVGTAGLCLLAAGAAGVIVDTVRAARRNRPDGTLLDRDRPPGGGATLALVVLALAAAWTAYLGTVAVRFERNLMPAVVLACAAAGHGLAALVGMARARNRALGAALAVVIAASMLGPATKSLAVVRRLAGDDTRTLAAEWIARNVPSGAWIVREEYTPQPDPRRYRVEYLWSLAFHDPDDYETNGVDVLVASHGVFGRFLTEAGRAQHAQMARHYDELLARPAAATFVPAATVNGPLIHVYRFDGARHERAR